MHGALLRTNAVRIRLLATARRKSGYLRYAAVRDVNLTALRYAPSVMRIGLLAFCHTAMRRRFSCAAYRFVAVRRSLNLTIRRP